MESALKGTHRTSLLIYIYQNWDESEHVHDNVDKPEPIVDYTRHSARGIHTSKHNTLRDTANAARGISTSKPHAQAK
jgi:hypothetical protein